MTYDWIDGGNRGAGPDRTLLFRSLQEDRGAPMTISRKPRGLQGPQRPRRPSSPPGVCDELDRASELVLRRDREM